MLLVGVVLRVEVQAAVPRDVVLVIFWPLNELGETVKKAHGPEMFQKP